MDIASLTLEVSGILLTVISLLREGAKRQKELASTLESYAVEAEQTQSIVDVVNKEDALKTSSAIAAIERLKTLGNSLKDQLETMGQPRGAIRGYVHQVTKGSAEEREIADIFVKLGRAKQDRILQMQIANVGLTKTVGAAIAVNTTLVEKVNEVLQRLLGQGEGLKIADFVTAKLEGKDLKAAGMVQITETEYQELQKEQIKTAHPETMVALPTSPDGTTQQQRIIVNNLTRDQALQINGPIALDMWDKIALIKIEGNVATGNSTQANYPITIEVFRELLAARAKS